MCFLKEVIGEQEKGKKNEHGSDIWMEGKWHSSWEEGSSKGLEADRIVFCLSLGYSLAQWQEAQKTETESFSFWAWIINYCTFFIVGYD